MSDVINVVGTDISKSYCFWVLADKGKSYLIPSNWFGFWQHFDVLVGEISEKEHQNGGTELVERQTFRRR